MHKVTVNIKLVIFGVTADSLVVFLKEDSLPAAFVQQDMSLDAQVEELYANVTGLQLGSNYSEQLYTTANEKNDITIVYYILIPLDHNQKYAAEWTKLNYAVKKSPDKSILSYAAQRLQWKIEYTNVVYSLLPKEFTLSELQKTYEAILGQILDKRNFRKKILSLKFLAPTGKRRVGVSRPAQVYTFTKRTPTLVKIFS